MLSAPIGQHRVLMRKDFALQQSYFGNRISINGHRVLLPDKSLQGTIEGYQLMEVPLTLSKLESANTVKSRRIKKVKSIEEKAELENTPASLFYKLEGLDKSRWRTYPNANSLMSKSVWAKRESAAKLKPIKDNERLGDQENKAKEDWQVDESFDRTDEKAEAEDQNRFDKAEVNVVEEFTLSDETGYVQVSKFDNLTGELARGVDGGTDLLEKNLKEAKELTNVFPSYQNQGASSCPAQLYP